MVTIEEKLKEVNKYLKAHENGKCYGMYIIEIEGLYYVGDSLGPMNFNRYTPIDEFYDSIKDIEKVELDTFRYRTNIDVNFETTIFTTPMNDEISLEDAEYYITYITEHDSEIRNRIANKLRKIADEIETGRYVLNGFIADLDGSEFYKDQFPYKEIDWKFVNDNIDKIKKE